ncbi:YIF1-domain-containing protein [Acaromyces ingoldii]|uniref:YIF1-domain-containing protein n=1 Tax=Acaromyces ingoldii TaxID=215250 RepID=A0A316YSE8_9BASI|nr:YIF1-domain-containing protein [Acaromyces ingoldii]PWN91946.1 YIF1-domain-containing protein [Acaromyces ingoldii]
MYQQNYGSSRSPPPLQHPKPTHPPFQVPDPPVTPNQHGDVGIETSPADPHLSSARARGAASSSVVGDSGYARYSSPPLQSNNNYPNSFGGAMQDPYASGAGGYASGNMGSQQQQQQQQQQQSSGGQGGFGAGFPNFGGFGLGQGGQPVFNDHTAQMGVHFGRQMAQVGGEYVEKNFNRILPLAVLKHYFNVSNSYVLHKLRLVLFPWRHRPWSRALRHGSGPAVGGVPPASLSMRGGPGSSGGAQENGPAYGSSASSGPSGSSKMTEGYAAPREDVNSPDLYIPVMALVTYVLLVSVIRGLESRFHPEVFGLILSRALGIVFFEFAAVKLGCYLLNIQGDHTMVDLLAYSGYKFVGAIVTLLVGLLRFGRFVYWSAFFYTCAANAFFLLRSLRYVVLPDPSSPSSVTITHAQRSRRIQFLFSIAVAQTLFGWFLIIGIWN